MLEGTGEWVLLDAPCSGTGTWRRNPAGRWRLSPARLERLVDEQARIMDIGAGLAVKGGTMVYAVCSLLDRERREQVDAFFRRNPGWRSEERRVGNACVSTCSYRWSPYLS